ncbi:MAG: TonB-dependent receptor [Bacteroidota bacterium]|nr:TonB-dependent receptor [Bacteroidota bacterium]
MAKWLRIVGAGLLLALHPLPGTAGGNTGKIVGTVTDGETGEVLPGAGVQIVGTTQGGATDIHGEYVILGVSPGVHSLRITMLGFATVVVDNVVVQSGLTTRVDVALTAEAIELQGDLLVSAQRPLVQRDETASVHYLDIAQLKALPVRSAREGLMLQTGVLFDPEPIVGGLGGSGRGESRYAVRGGDQTEVAWFVDGARTTALVEARADQGGSFTHINMHAVQEIQILTGGFEAQYGGAQSGIVNVVTREGGPRYTASLEYNYGPAGQRHFGNYLYDPATQKEYLDNTLENGSLDPDWWTPLRSGQIYDYRAIGDHQIYASLGGPIFTRGQTRATFFAASQYKREAYTYPRPRDRRELDDVMGNVVLQVRPGMKLRIGVLYNHLGHSTLQENGDFIQQVKFYRGWGSLLNSRTTLLSAEWTHALSPTFFYDVRLSRFRLNMREKPSEFTRLGTSDNPTLFGFQRYNGYPDEPYDAWTFIIDRHQEVGDLSLESSANWQVNRNNFIKAGLELRRNTLQEHYSYRYPSFSTGPQYWLNRGLHETYHPIEFAAYLQDKMEFNSMVLNMGVRYDLFHPNVDWFTTRDLFNLSVDPQFDPSLDPDRDQVDANGRVKYSYENVLAKPRSPARAFHRVSPRIGVSFPISDRTVLHFNYGHFYQMPPMDRMFEFNYFRPEYIVKGQIAEEEAAATEGHQPGHIRSLDGDPERVVVLSLDALRPEKTILFEVGLVRNFGNIAVLDMTGFYKDVFDQTMPRQGIFDRRVYMYDPFRDAITPNVFYVSSFSGDYGDSRGFEITLRTVFSHWYALRGNYSYSRVTHGRATPGTIRYEADGTAEYVYDIDVSRRLPTETTFSRPHIMRANFFMRYPREEATSWISAALKGTSLSALLSYVSGRAFTYVGPEDPPDTRDNHRLPPIRTLDLRLEKSFQVSGEHSLALYANVTNVLNTRNLRSFGDVIFDADAVRNYVESGEISTVDAAGYDIGWQTYFAPRQFHFGLRYNLR